MFAQNKQSGLIDTTLKPLVIADTLILPFSKDTLEAPVEYTAQDSIIYDIAHKQVYLYGNATIKQNSISIKAYSIQFNQEAKTVKAIGKIDSTGYLVQTPIFNDGTRQYLSDEMLYNFDTKKGKIKHVITKEGDGFLSGNEVKKNANNEMFATGAYYTTCNLEHPHFKIAINKVKVIPNKVIVSGPAQLIIEDVPTPLILPFGIFPLKKGQSSGIILPTYGYSNNRGFYFTRGGYYFGLGQYADLAILGDIYTSGNWRLSTNARYKKRYKFSGNLELNYAKNLNGDPITTDFSTSSDFYVSWRHSQDPKAKPNSVFSADVKVGTSTYNKEFEYTNNNVLTNTLSSSIAYQYNFPYLPFTFAMRAAHSQNTQTNLVNITLPELSFIMSRQQPFKRKTAVGKTKWFEKIGVSYSANAKAFVQSPDSIVYTKALIDSIRHGVKQHIDVNTDITLFKFINIRPSINFEELWDTKTIEKTYVADTTYLLNNAIEGTYDTILPHIKTNTLNGFKAAHWYNGSITASTKLFGMFVFKGKLKAIRHVFTPNLGLAFTPNFGTEKLGYYKKLPIKYYSVNNNAYLNDTLTYSIFSKSIYGGPTNSPQTALTFGFNNNLQMKLYSKKTSKGDTIISIFDNFSFASSYNFIADSLKLAPINFSASTKITKLLDIGINGTLDAYKVDSLNRRVNKWVINEDKKLTRLDDIGFTLSSTLGSKKKANRNSSQGTKQEQDEIINYPDAFIDFNIPWTINLSYTLKIDNKRINSIDTTVLIQTFNSKLNLNLTDKWRVSLDTGYDFTNKEVSRTTLNIIRDLHCWEMSFNLVPFGKYRRYDFNIHVKSELLQDLKLSRKRSWQDF